MADEDKDKTEEEVIMARITELADELMIGEIHDTPRKAAIQRQSYAEIIGLGFHAGLLYASKIINENPYV